MQNHPALNDQPYPSLTYPARPQLANTELAGPQLAALNSPWRIVISRRLLPASAHPTLIYLLFKVGRILMKPPISATISKVASEDRGFLGRSACRRARSLLFVVWEAHLADPRRGAPPVEVY